MRSDIAENSSPQHARIFPYLGYSSCPETSHGVIVLAVRQISVGRMLSQPAGNHCMAALALTVFMTACSSQAPRSTPAADRPITTTPIPASPRMEAYRTVREYAAVAALRQVRVPYRCGILSADIHPRWTPAVAKRCDSNWLVDNKQLQLLG